MEDNRVIERYVAVVNQKAVGLPASVFVSIKLDAVNARKLFRSLPKPSLRGAKFKNAIS